MPPWINLANLLTLVRLLLVPFVIQAILTGHPVLAEALFGAAAITDVLDGAAARRMQLVTRSGAYFDPIADKALLSGVFVALALSGTVPLWLVGVVLGRDLFILAGVAVFLLSTPIRKFPPSVWGKLSTFVQIVSVVVWMTRNSFKNFPLDGLASAMIWICAACTIWSGLHYTWRGIQIARAH
jgi:cardiolipin synthase (CMP-forming)